MKNILPNLIIFLLLIISIVNFSGFTIDDALITFRYGQNFVLHGCWDYNPNCITKTNAITNFSYGLFSIIPEIININSILFFKIFSTILIIIYIIYFYKNFKSSFYYLIFFLWFPHIILITYSGLETFLFILLQAIFFINIFKKNYKYGSLILTLLVLTRPESFVFLGLYFVYLVLKNELNSHFLLPIITSILYFGFNLLYFNDLLPSSFYFKSYFSNDDFIKATLVYVFFMSPLFYIIYRNVNEKYFSFFICFAYSIIIFKYAISTQDANNSYRMYFQLLIPIYLISIITTSNSTKSLIYPKILSFLIFSFFLIGTHLKPSTYFGLKNKSQITLKEKKIGEYFSIKGNPLIVSSQAGAIPFFSRSNSLDNNGLANIKILNEGFDLELITKKKIDYIVLFDQIIPEDTYNFNTEIFKTAKINYFHYPITDYTLNGDIKIHIFSKNRDEELIDIITDLDEYKYKFFSNSLKFWLL